MKQKLIYNRQINKWMLAVLTLILILNILNLIKECLHKQINNTNNSTEQYKPKSDTIINVSIPLHGKFNFK
ncbi:MAG: hypothetical protein HPY79_10515 [Bacteroidales bacterium]|nr:hypothetical protein [Bacteroidales bacterium]